MNSTDRTSTSLLARSVTAEIRARMAAQRVSGKKLAELAGMSQNYFATRLRDEKPFTLDDVEVIVRELAEDEETLVESYVHGEVEAAGAAVLEVMGPLLDPA